MTNGITIKHSYDRSTLRIEIEIDRDIVEKSLEMEVHVNPKAPRARPLKNNGLGRRTIDF